MQTNHLWLGLTNPRKSLAFLRFCETEKSKKSKKKGHSTVERKDTDIHYSTNSIIRGSFLRNQSRNPPPMKEEGSPHCSHDPATVPYPEPRASSAHSHVLCSSDLRMPKYPEWFLPFMFSNENFVLVSYFSHAWSMSTPSHPPWFDCPVSLWWTVLIK
jgi:hypothetical protein